MALRRNWTKIDKHASQAKDADCKTYKTLVAYLDKPIKNNPDRDIYMTRALIYWWFCNDSKKIGQTGSDSPLALLNKTKDGSLPFAAVFKELCNKADVKCEAISGICKSGSYEPGDTDEKNLSGSWNKVWLQGKWWPVYPRWIIQSLSGVISSGFTKIETTGHATTGTEASSQGQTVHQFNDFWFLTDPQIFVNKCFPHNPEDQMLPTSKRVKSKRKFLKLPYYTLNFFHSGLRLTSDDSCIVEAEGGIGRVSFRSDRIKAKHLVFDYDLYIKEAEEDGASSTRAELPSGRLVLNTRRKGHFIFEVRCPVEGTYKLDIRGGTTNSSQFNIFLKTTIRCREKVDSIKPLPIEVGEIGFGIGPHATENGLSKPSVPTPKVCVVPRKATVFKFKTEKDSKKTHTYSVELFGKDKTSAELKDTLKTTTDKQELTVSVTVPEAGEYVLRINCGDSSTEKVKTICNYLLTSEEDKDEVAEEYYDSSDGFSEDDEEIGKLVDTIQTLEQKRNELLKKLAEQKGEDCEETASLISSRGILN